MDRKTLTALLATVVAGNGCSSLEGSRFDHEASRPDTTLHGVPFTMNRPVPTVTRVPGTGGAPDKYTLTFGYEPDPDGRYTLQVDPALLSSVDFQMTFDANGSLTETTAKTVDQTAPMIVAVGKLALAAAAFEKIDKPTKDPAQEIVDKGNELLKEGGPVLVDTIRGGKRAVTREDQNAWKAVQTRLIAADQLGLARKTFAYLDRREHEILLTLLERDRKIDLAGQPTFKKDYDKFKNKKEATKLKAEEVRTAFENSDARKLKALKAELVVTRAGLRAAAKIDPNNQEVTAAQADNLDLIKLVAVAKIPPYQSMLLELADPEPIEWQRRALAILNADIARRRHALQVAASSQSEHERIGEATDSELAKLLDRKAAALGVAAEHRRRLEIGKQLAATKNPKELKELRDEYAALEALEASAEAALKPKAAPDAKTEEPAVAEWKQIPHGILHSTQTIKEGLGKHRPDYVVVVQPLRSAPATPGNTPSTPSPKEQPGTTPGSTAPDPAPLPPLGALPEPDQPPKK